MKITIESKLISIRSIIIIFLFISFWEIVPYQDQYCYFLSEKSNLPERDFLYIFKECFISHISLFSAIILFIKILFSAIGVSILFQYIFQILIPSYIFRRKRSPILLVSYCLLVTVSFFLTIRLVMLCSTDQYLGLKGIWGNYYLHILDDYTHAGSTWLYYVLTLFGCIITSQELFNRLCHKQVVDLKKRVVHLLYWVLLYLFLLLVLYAFSYLMLIFWIIEVNPTYEYY